jgi:hypothetical protein
MVWKAQKRGLKVECKDVIVLLDREQGAADVASLHGISFQIKKTIMHT